MDERDCLLLDPKDQPSSSTIFTSTPVSTSSTSPIIKHTKESIMLSLKYKKNEYKIVHKKSNSSCWSVFGLPARIVGPDSYEIIPKFASCKTCFQTYSYSSTTSTLSNHKCSSLTNQNQSKIQVTKISKSVIASTTNDASSPTRPANNKLLEKHKHLVTTAISDWMGKVVKCRKNNVDGKLSKNNCRKADCRQGKMSTWKNVDIRKRRQCKMSRE